MKHVLFLGLLIVTTISINAQSFFKPLPKLNESINGKMGVSSGSVLNSIRPVADITATVSNGAQLAGGIGIGFQHNQWDASSQTWITEYSISGLIFLGTNGNKITTTTGLVVGIPGTNGIIQLGYGYDFTGKQPVLLTGVGIKFN